MADPDRLLSCDNIFPDVHAVGLASLASGAADGAGVAVDGEAEQLVALALAGVHAWARTHEPGQG